MYHTKDQSLKIVSAYSVYWSKLSDSQSVSVPVFRSGSWDSLVVGLYSFNWNIVTLLSPNGLAWYNLNLIAQKGNLNKYLNKNFTKD